MLMFFLSSFLCVQVHRAKPSESLLKNGFDPFVGDNSVQLRERIWMKLGGNSSCKPPGDSYTAQGPQKQLEIFKTNIPASILNRERGLLEID